MSNIIQAILSNGSVLPLREYRSKSAGNICYGTLGTKANGERYFSSFGVKVTEQVTGDVSAIDSITVLDKTFPVTSAMEPKKDDDLNPIPGTERLVLRAEGRVKVNGKQKAFTFRLTPGTDTHNVNASINGVRGEGGGVKATDSL